MSFDRAVGVNEKDRTSEGNKGKREMVREIVKDKDTKRDVQQ